MSRPPPPPPPPPPRPINRSNPPPPSSSSSITANPVRSTPSSSTTTTPLASNRSPHLHHHHNNITHHSSSNINDNPSNSSPSLTPSSASIDASSLTSTSSSSSSSSSSFSSASSSISSFSLPSPTTDYPLMNILSLASSNDDIVRGTANFIYSHIHQPSIEIEGKIGYLFTRYDRLIIPGVLSLTLIDEDEAGVKRFNSELDEPLFKHLNENILKNRFFNEMDAANKENRPSLIHYQHIKQIDKFYEIGGNRNNKYRASYTITNDGNKINVSSIPSVIVQKSKLSNKNYYGGGVQSMDFRISISEEKEIDYKVFEEATKGLTPELIREKNRLSYKYSLFSIDLTFVRQVDAHYSSSSAYNYEVEIEIIDMDYLRQQASLVASRQPSKFLDIIASFVDQIRTICKYTNPQLPIPDTCLRNQQRGIKRSAPDA